MYTLILLRLNKSIKCDIYLVEVVIIDIMRGRVWRPVLLIVRTVHLGPSDSNTTRTQRH